MVLTVLARVISQRYLRSDCESLTHVVVLSSKFTLPLSVCVSDSPHCEPPLVEEPAPDTVSVSHNSEDGKWHAQMHSCHRGTSSRSSSGCHRLNQLTFCRFFSAISNICPFNNKAAALTCSALTCLLPILLQSVFSLPRTLPAAVPSLPSRASRTLRPLNLRLVGCFRVRPGRGRRSLRLLRPDQPGAVLQEGRLPAPVPASLGRLVGGAAQRCGRAGAPPVHSGPRQVSRVVSMSHILFLTFLCCGL